MKTSDIVTRATEIIKRLSMGYDDDEANLCLMVSVGIALGAKVEISAEDLDDYIRHEIAAYITARQNDRRKAAVEAGKARGVLPLGLPGDIDHA